MSKIRLILVALAALFAMSAVTAASASATELELYLVNGKPIAAGEDVPVVVANGSATLQGGGLKTTCTKVTSEGSFLAEGRSDITMTFESCTVEEPGPGKCIVREPIVIKMQGHVLLFESKPADIFTPEVGNIFVELHLLNAAGQVCAIEGLLPLTGSMQAVIANGATEEVEHEQTFNASSGSQLEVAGSSFLIKLKSKVSLGGSYKGDKFSVTHE